MKSRIVGFLTLRFTIGLNRNKLVKGQKFIERKSQYRKRKKNASRKEVLYKKYKKCTYQKKKTDELKKSTSKDVATVNKI